MTKVPDLPSPPPPKTLSISLSVLVPWALSVATALIGVAEFSIQQGAANRRPFLERQLELVFQASDDAAVLATTADPKIWNDARIDFNRIYFGKLVVVEDPALAGAMYNFVQHMPPANEEAIDLPTANLQPEARAVAEAARGLIARSWGVDLRSLDPPTARRFKFWWDHSSR